MHRTSIQYCLVHLNWQGPLTGALSVIVINILLSWMPNTNSTM
jgi:hypothetical protein